MKKLIVLSIMLITGCAPIVAQTFTPAINSTGWINWMAQNSLAPQQTFNLRLTNTLGIMRNDLDSIANRSNKGGAVNVTAGFIPVSAGLSFVNSKLQQAGLAVKLTPGTYISGPDTAYLFGFSKGGDTILINGTRTLILMKKDSIQIGVSGKVASHVSRIAIDSNHVQLISYDGKFVLKDRTNNFRDTVILSNLTANRSDTISDANGTIPVAQRLARGTLTNTNGAYSWAPIGLRTYQAGVPFDSTGTITAAKLAVGYITSTSGAGVTLTTPTATALATALGSIGARTVFTFVIDNSAGSNTVTVALDASIVANAVITGGNTLTVASGKIGVFQMVFTSTTSAQIGRIQ